MATSGTRAQVPEVLKRQKCFLHIDLDCFFAQVEQIRLGLSADVPLVSQQWDAIIAVNYSARKYGITRLHHNVFDAKQLCPDLVCAHVATLGPGDSQPDYYPAPSRYTHKVSLDPYRKASAKIFRVFAKYCPKYQKGGLDEVFMDVTDAVNQKIMEEYGEDLSRWDRDTTEMLDWKRDHPEAGVVFGLDAKGAAESGSSLEDDAEDDHESEEEGRESGEEAEDDAQEEELEEEDAHAVGNEDDFDFDLEGYMESDFDEPSLLAAPTGLGNSISVPSEAAHPTAPVAETGASADETTKTPEELEQEKEAEAERLRLELEYLRPYYAVPEGEFDERFWAEMQLLKAAEICNEIRAAVKAELKYTCSAGVSSNKLLAKLGSGMNKPYQQTIILPKYTPDLLHRIKLSKIRGLGGKFGRQVKTDYNLERASQLWVVPLRELQEKYGAQAGLELWQWCRGIDRVGVRKVKSKSMCSHKSFIPALSDLEEIQFWIANICREVESRVQTEYEETERWPRTIALGFFGGVNAYRDPREQEHRPTVFAPPHKGTRSMPFASRFEYGGTEGMARKMYATLEKLIHEAETGRGRPILPLVILSVTVSNFAAGPGSALGDITKFFSKAPTKGASEPAVSRNALVHIERNTTAVEAQGEGDGGVKAIGGHATQSTTNYSPKEPTEKDQARRRFFGQRSESSTNLKPPSGSSQDPVVSKVQEGSSESVGLMLQDADSTASESAIAAHSTMLLCELCPSPGQQIAPEDWEEHKDYHFALSLLEEDRKQQQVERQQQQQQQQQQSTKSSPLLGGTHAAKRSSSSSSSSPTSSNRTKKKKTKSAEGSASASGTSSSVGPLSPTPLSRFFKPA